jgi:hypothetical protein
MSDTPADSGRPQIKTAGWTTSRILSAVALNLRDLWDSISSAPGSVLI